MLDPQPSASLLQLSIEPSQVGDEGRLAIRPSSVEQRRIKHEERRDLVGLVRGRRPGGILGKSQIPTEPNKMMNR